MIDGVIMNNELQELVKTFFQDYLDVTEESDSGNIFHPITINCCRVLKVQPLNELLAKMRELAFDDTVE